jgi:hypothetical protein
MNRGWILRATTLVVAAGLIGSWWGVATASLAIAIVWSGVAARRLVLGSLCGVGLVAVSWLAGNAGRLGEVTFDLVTENPWPHRFAVLTVVLLMCGVFLDFGDRREPVGTR